jgi:hypothetical protein
MREKLLILALIFTCPLTSIRVGSRDQQAEHLVHLSRTSFETGFTYESEPIAEARISCQAYHWSVIVDWGDGSPPELLGHAAPYHLGDRTAPGSYALLSTHRYLRRGTYKADVRLLVNCSGRDSKLVGHYGIDIGVYDHIPVKSFAVADQSAKRGSEVVLLISLASAAPPSGTRLFLRSDKADVFAWSVPYPVDVPPYSDQKSIVARVLPAAPTGNVLITLTAANGRKSLSIDVER